jgi:hypothetical protein
MRFNQAFFDIDFTRIYEHGRQKMVSKIAMHGRLDDLPFQNSLREFLLRRIVLMEETPLKRERRLQVS